MTLTKQVTLATRTKHSGPRCFWQCFRVQTCWMRRYRFEGVLNYNLLLCRNVKNILLKLITLSMCNIKSLIHFPLVWLGKKVILLKKCIFVCLFSSDTVKVRPWSCLSCPPTHPPTTLSSEIERVSLWQAHALKPIHFWKLITIAIHLRQWNTNTKTKTITNTKTKTETPRQ